MFKQTEDDQSVLSMITFTFKYYGEIGQQNGYKIVLKLPDKTSLNSKSLFIINPIGTVNPRSKATEIYKSIMNIASKFNIDKTEIKIVLDLLEITGIEKKHLFDWAFHERDGEVQEEILKMQFNSDEDRVLFQNYYHYYLSLFTNSALNNKQKAEIVAYAIAEKCYDAYSVDNILKNFKIILSKAVQNREDLKTALTKNF